MIRARDACRQYARKGSQWVEPERGKEVATPEVRTIRKVLVRNLLAPILALRTAPLPASLS